MASSTSSPRPRCPRYGDPVTPADDQGDSWQCLYFALTKVLKWIVYTKYTPNGVPQRLLLNEEELRAGLLQLTAELQESQDTCGDVPAWLCFRVIMEELQKHPVKVQASDDAENLYLVSAGWKQINTFDMTFRVCEEENAHMVIVYRDDQDSQMAHAVAYQGVWEWPGETKEIYCSNSYGLREAPVVTVTDLNFEQAFLVEPSVIRVSKHGPPYAHARIPQDARYEAYAEAFSRDEWGGDLFFDRATGKGEWVGEVPAEGHQQYQGHAVGAMRMRGASKRKGLGFQLESAPEVEEMRAKMTHEWCNGIGHWFKGALASNEQEREEAASGFLDSAGRFMNMGGTAAGEAGHPMLQRGIADVVAASCHSRGSDDVDTQRMFAGFAQICLGMAAAGSSSSRQRQRRGNS